jgi:uncharacterized protein
MKIFLDTSALVKLYHQEAGTSELENVFAQATITHIFLSELAKIEFASTVWKKVRTKEMNEQQANETLAFFEQDFGTYSFVAVDRLIVEQARELITQYGKHGLRTLDSIQFSTAITLSERVEAFLTADNLLQTFLEAEGLRTHLPNK